MERIQELLPQGLDEANLLETTGGAVKFAGLKVRKAKASDLRPAAMTEEVINGKIPEISDSLKAVQRLQHQRRSWYRADQQGVQALDGRRWTSR